jgi:hypothetical protein
MLSMNLVNKISLFPWSWVLTGSFVPNYTKINQIHHFSTIEVQSPTFNTSDPPVCTKSNHHKKFRQFYILRTNQISHPINLFPNLMNRSSTTELFSDLLETTQNPEKHITIPPIDQSTIFKGGTSITNISYDEMLIIFSY